MRYVHLIRWLNIKYERLFCLLLIFFLSPSVTRKDIPQLVKYPRVLCVKPSNIVYVSMMHRVHACSIYKRWRSVRCLTYIQHPGFLIYFKYRACMQHNMKIHAFDKLYTKGVSDKTPKEMKYFHTSVNFFIVLRILKKFPYQNWNKNDHVIGRFTLTEGKNRFRFQPMWSLLKIEKTKGLLL